MKSGSQAVFLPAVATGLFDPPPLAKEELRSEAAFRPIFRRGRSREVERALFRRLIVGVFIAERRYARPGPTRT